MKKMKKLLSMLLAVVMVLAMAAPSFAETSEGQTGTIKLDNPQEGVTYTAYKIFDVRYADNSANSEEYTYYIDKDSAFYNVANTYFNLIAASGNENTYYVESLDNGSAAAFANALRDMNLSGIEGKELTSQADGSVSVSGLELGYYFVDNNSTKPNALCNLTTTNPVAEIHEKNEVPTITKEITSKFPDGYEIGSSIPYSITGKVPDLTGYKAYTYKVTDTMSKGLDFDQNSTVTVTIGSFTKTYRNTDPELEITTMSVKDADGNDVNVPHFELTLNLVALRDGNNGQYSNDITYNAPITITYSATVNAQAAGQVIDNKAQLYYSNDPSDAQGGEPEEGTEVEVKTYSTQIEINKYAYDAEQTDGKGISLKDAKFWLYNEDQTLVYKFENGEVKWVDPNTTTPTEKITGADGKVTFDGLKAGKYYLEEIEAPSGYNRLVDRVEVEIKEVDDKALNDGTAILTKTADVANHAGTVLPSTGGIGTTIFYAAGIILMAGAVFFVVRKRRA